MIDQSRPHGKALALHWYRPLYLEDVPNRCPGCGMSHWLVGRITAECASCGTALPLEHTGIEGSSTLATFWKRDITRNGHVNGYGHRSEMK